MKQGTEIRQEATTPQSLLLRIKEDLRPQVLDRVRVKGLTNELFNEYRRLAGATERLLSMLGTRQFAAGLTDEERGQYDLLLACLGESGVRCQILVEESEAASWTTYLETADLDSPLPN